MADKTNKTEALETSETKVEKTPAKAAKPVKEKVSFFKKIGTFFKENKAELKKIVWYGKNQTIRTTVVVLVALVICSAAISLLDLGFSSVISMLSRLL